MSLAATSACVKLVIAVPGAETRSNCPPESAEMVKLRPGSASSTSMSQSLSCPSQISVLPG